MLTNLVASNVFSPAAILIASLVAADALVPKFLLEVYLIVNQ